MCGAACCGRVLLAVHQRAVTSSPRRCAGPLVDAAAEQLPPTGLHPRAAPKHDQIVLLYTCVGGAQKSAAFSAAAGKAGQGGGDGVWRARQPTKRARGANVFAAKLECAATMHACMLRCKRRAGHTHTHTHKNTCARPIRARPRTIIPQPRQKKPQQRLLLLR